MIVGGQGGGNTITGLRFEERVDLATVLMNIPSYSVSGNLVYFNGQVVANIYKKHKLYNDFLFPKGVDYRNIISKQLLPDQSIYVHRTNTLYVIEMKFQKTSGSVDEKLQTCDFKKKQYIKLLSPLNINVEYFYVLNDWFRKKEYKDTLDYIESVGCKYFYNEIPLDYIGLALSK
jgi:hypothetical protein